MKRILKLLRVILASVLSLLVSFVIIAFFEGELFPNKIINSFDCDYQRTHHFDRSFRDTFTFSCYDLYSPQIDDEVFAPVTEEALFSITRCLNVFERLVSGHNPCEVDGDNCEVTKNYSFNRSTLDSSDYFWLDNKPDYGFVGDFDLYIFDTATNALYHFQLTS